MRATIIIADDHPLMLSGNKQFLEEKRFHVIDTAADGNEAYNKIICQSPDIAILDFDMPKLNGLELAKALKVKNFPTKVVILTLHKQTAIVEEIGKSIDGYITKEAALKEFENCLDQVLKGKTYVGLELRQEVKELASLDVSRVLSITERKILKYLAKDLTSIQIAEELFISKRTVEKHRSNIIQKLGLDSKSHTLILWVQKHPEIFDI